MRGTDTAAHLLLLIGVFAIVFSLLAGATLAFVSYAPCWMLSLRGLPASRIAECAGPRVD